MATMMQTDTVPMHIATGPATLQQQVHPLSCSAPVPIPCQRSDSEEFSDSEDEYDFFDDDNLEGEDG